MDAGTALRNGQVLDLVAAGLTRVSQSELVRPDDQARARAGQLLEVVTDSANRIVSSRRVTQ